MMPRLGWLGGLVGALVVGAIVAAFLVMGSPAEARRRTADEQRVTDLTSIVRLVREHVAEHKSLPAKLDDLHLTYESPRILRDPETDKQYGYRVLSPSQFELSVTYETDTVKLQSPPYGGSAEVPMRHHKGFVKLQIAAKAKPIGLTP